VIYNSCSTNHFLSWSTAGNGLYKEANQFKKSGSDGTLKNICWTLFLQSVLSAGDSACLNAEKKRIWAQ
jgi:hypothetical protein